MDFLSSCTKLKVLNVADTDVKYIDAVANNMFIPQIINTVVTCEKFIPNNWWCKCCLSAWNGGCPLSNLLIIANDVSKIGIPKIVIGIKNEINAGPLNSNKVITAIINPINVAQSPANILAG